MTRSKFSLPCEGHITAKPGFFLVHVVEEIEFTFQYRESLYATVCTKLDNPTSISES